MTKERLEKIYNIGTNQGLFVSNAYEVGTNVKVDFVCPHHPKYVQTVNLVTFAKGTKCKYCKMEQEYNHIYNQLKTKGYTLLSEKYSYDKTKTYVDFFKDQVKKTPDEVALVFEDKKMTYKELDDYSNKIANYLIKSKIKKKNKIV